MLRIRRWNKWHSTLVSAESMIFSMLYLLSPHTSSQYSLETLNQIFSICLTKRLTDGLPRDWGASVPFLMQSFTGSPQCHKCFQWPTGTEATSALLRYLWMLNYLICPAIFHMLCKKYDKQIQQSSAYAVTSGSFKWRSTSRFFSS